MTMRVHGHAWSINTRKTMMTLAEKGHEAELVVVALPTGEQRSPEHLARHPFAKVPVLDHDGFVVYESRAINAYLDRVLAGPALVPEDQRGRAVDRRVPRREQERVALAERHIERRREREHHLAARD